MVIDDSGRVFACGDSDNAAGTATAGFVLSYASDGARRFARLYPRTAPRDTSFAAVLADGRGGAYVCGRVSEPQAYRHRLIAHYAATGSRAWARSVTNMAVQGDDEYEALARCGSAGVAAAGSYLYAADDSTRSPRSTRNRRAGHASRPPAPFRAVHTTRIPA